MDIYTIALMLSTVLALFLAKKYSIMTPRGIYSVQRIRSAWTVFLALLPLTLVVAFRWNVGVDSVYGESYSYAYHYAALGINYRDFEWGYFIFSAIFSVLRVPYFWFLFVISIFYMVCTSYSISRISVSPAISILTFVLMLPYFDSFSALRQAIAQAICLLGLARWMNPKEGTSKLKRDIMYLVSIVIASLFHGISILYFILFFFCRLNYGQKSILIISMVLVAATPVLSPLLSFLGSYLSGGQYSPQGFASSYALVSLVIFALCLWKYYDIQSINPQAVFLINHSLVTFILMLNSSALVLPFRIYDALKINYIFTLPFIVKSFKNKTYGILVCLFLLALMGVFYLNAMYANDSVFREYHSVFESWGRYSMMY